MKTVSAASVKSWLDDRQELAFLDVREHGQYGEGHPFFAIPLPYSEFEHLLVLRVPRLHTRMVLLDASDGVALSCAQAAQRLGYTNVHTLDGGADAWQEAGYTLYQGVNVPSKAFGELLEHARNTPRVSAAEVQQMQADDADAIILDGRPYAEFNKMSIPQGICCPNGELAYRVHDLVADDKTTIIVNCAGRTRSILGAQTLIDAGVRNPVFALENGTQGWFLEGLKLDAAATQRYPEQVSATDREEQTQRVHQRALAAGVTFMDSAGVQQILDDTSCNSYVLDVRTEEEFSAGGIAGSVHAPGGQLIQATDQWIAVRHAKILLPDFDGIRAPLCAYWLQQLGHDAIVFKAEQQSPVQPVLRPHATNEVDAPEQPFPTVLAKDLDLPDDQLIDLRSSASYRLSHIQGARWSIRPALRDIELDLSRRVVLVGAHPTTTLVASDLRARGYEQVGLLQEDWQASDLPMESTADIPADQERVDFLFFTAERHSGNEAASRQYLEWEINLVKQLDQQEAGVFRLLDTETTH